MDSLKAKANYFKLCHLLVDKGGGGLRGVLHAVHPPSSLAAVLNANKSVLKKLQHRVITTPEWNLLFPASGTPDSKNFSITLLTILLSSICGFSPPVTGWNAMPLASDTSVSADIVRIKIFRNNVYGHMPSPRLDDLTFETLWQEISLPLLRLGIPQRDIDETKVAPLNPKIENYVEMLKQPKEIEGGLLSELNDVDKKVNEGTVYYLIY